MSAMDIQQVDNLLKDFLARQRQDVRRKICSLSEAMYILGIDSRKTFYELEKKKESLIRKSSLKGKYNLNSINREADRLNRTR